MLWQILIVHRSAWYPLLSACRHVEFDTFVICRVFQWIVSAHFYWYAFKSPWITFEEIKHEIYCKHVAYLDSVLWRRARLWLKLLGRFLLQITSLSSYVFLHTVFPERNEAEQWHIQHAKQSTDLHVNSYIYGARTTKRGRNLYIEQEKHKLDQIVARNIRMSIDKRIACFVPSKASSWRLAILRKEPKQCTETHDKLQRCQTQRGDMQVTADTMQTHEL